MTSLAAPTLQPIAGSRARSQAAARDLGIDTMRGLAILMVIGIHSLAQPPGGWQIAVDAMLRPCVPIFLFASGYLTALSGRVPIGKRLQAALIPYAIAFSAAYIYMAAHNPAMDHRLTTTAARFVLAYVFVYYYVFVYIGCTLVLWLVYATAPADPERRAPHLATVLLLAIGFGVLAGSYVDPLLSRFGVSEGLVEEVRLRDLPFWFCFMAIGVLAGLSTSGPEIAGRRLLLAGATVVAFVLYAAIRLTGIGDAATYDSVAFLLYAGLLCCLLLGLRLQSRALAWLGSGSYFIYLWHIFIVMAVRDHFAALRQTGPAMASSVTFAVAASGSILALIAVRQIAPFRLRRWLGA
ncbi:acyltransferase family protein [Rhodopseudomonas sp. NSM]|uniref:acyltransferase family protein n=1 Tax=Rhodopseudomonas sp. NSM TaxID=3457630 RepID=UPI00403585D4